MINLLFVGDTQVGKSSLIERFCRNTYSESYTDTKGVENIKKTIEYNDSTLELQIFDASGKPENRKALKEYYEKVSGILLVFSLTDRSSFNSVKKWMDTLQKNLSPAIPIVLVGNKQDVGEKIVSPEDINQIIEEYKLKYYEVSAKENIRVSELFTGLVKQAKSGKGTPRHQLSRQNSSGTPRKLILQSLQSFGEVSQTVLTQKIQEQMAMLKVELLESMEEQRKKELENMEMKIQTLEKQLQSSQGTIAKEIELKTSSYINELKEENRNLVSKMTQLENNLGVKAALLEQGNPEECHDRNSVYYHDSSVHESEGKFINADFAKQFEDEIHEIKRRLTETDIRLIQTLRHVDTKLSTLHLALMKEVNLRAGGALTDAELLAIGEKFTEPPQSTDDLPTLNPRIPSQKNKHGRVKAYSNFALSVNTPGKTGSISHRRKFSALDGGDNAEPKLGRDYINSETIIRGESQVSPAVIQPHPASMFIYNEENNNDGNGQPQESDQYNHSNLHIGNLSEAKIDDGHHEINSGFRMEEGFRNIEEEITLIWRTINTIIENAQDQISRLRTEYSPTTNQAQKGDDQEPVSLSEFRNDETPVDLLKKDYVSEEPKTPVKNAQPEKDLKTTLIELKDDVHNQILGVQREFEKELLGLKDILMGHYKNFSGKMEQENFALRDYIDNKIEELSMDIDKVLINYEPEIIRSTRSMSEGKIIRSSTQSKEAVFDHLEVAPVNNNTGSIVDLKDYVTETKLKEVQDMQEELGKSIWETISLMANRLAQVEQDVVTKIIQQAQKKV